MEEVEVEDDEMVRWKKLEGKHKRVETRLPPRACEAAEVRQSRTRTGELAMAATCTSWHKHITLEPLPFGFRINGSSYQTPFQRRPRAVFPGESFGSYALHQRHLLSSLLASDEANATQSCESLGVAPRHCPCCSSSHTRSSYDRSLLPTASLPGTPATT